MDKEYGFIFVVRFREILVYLLIIFGWLFVLLIGVVVVGEFVGEWG